MLCLVKPSAACSLPLALLLLTSACYSHAPPVRMAHLGAPGRIGEGSFDVAAAVTSVGGGQTLGYGLSDKLAVEGGIESNFTDVVMGFAGVRYTPLPPGRRKIAFVLDLEGGTGAGVGGRVCNDSAECSAPGQNLRRPAGGGYLGVGIGARIHFFSPYLRARQQLTGARDVPMTGYTTVLAGVQFAIFDSLHLWAGTGFLYVVTSEGRSNIELPRGTWLAYDVGLSLTFGGWRQREALERHWQRRARQSPK